jgi:hypothetical protein
MKILVELDITDITPEHLSDLLSALNRVQAVPKQRKAAPPEETKAAPPKETEEPPKKTRKKKKTTKKRQTTEIKEDDVRKALTAYKNEYGKTAAREKIQKFGVSKVADLDPDDYPALLAELV